MIFKKGGKTRWIADFRVINSVSERSYAAVPDLATVVANFDGTEFLSNLDMKSSYWQRYIQMTVTRWLGPYQV